MPKVTLYIREDDYDKWKLIKNKSELVSQAINQKVSTPPIHEREVLTAEDGSIATVKNNLVGKPKKKCTEHLCDP